MGSHRVARSCYRGAWAVGIAGLLALLTLPALSLPRPTWRDLDGDGTRFHHELLVEQCIVTYSPTGRIASARCLDGYSGRVLDSSAPSREIDLDHRIPWAIARERRQWSKEAAKAFFHYRSNLVLTSASTNRSKGARMPGQWCPELPAARPEHARGIEADAAYWGIPLTEEEQQALERWKREEC